MASISSLGSGSNLDLQGILDDLRSNSELQLNPIKNRQTSFKAQISAYGQLKSALENLQKAAAALAKPETLRAVTGSSSNESVLTTTVEAGAIPGEYSIEVSQLASTQRLESKTAVASRTDQNGTGGTIEFVVGGKTHTVTLGSDTSLNGVVKAINDDDSSPVRATIVNGEDGAHLMLSSKTEGTANAITSISTDNGQLADILSYDAEDGAASQMQVQQEAKDAIFTVNGITATSSTNQVSNVIDGVTLNLTGKTTADNPVTISVTSDPAAAKDAVKKFVDAYNSLQTTIANLTAFDTTAQTQNALTGDSTTRSIQSAVAAALRVTSGEGVLHSLSELGITTDATSGSNGKLLLDNTKLEAALQDNLADVSRIFAGENGLADRMDAAITPIVSSNGLIKHRTDGLQDSIDSLQDQLDRTQDSIDSEIEIYRQQFVRLDVLMSQLTSTSNYLTQQFAGMAAQR